MKIQLLSDLHLETQPGFEARPAPQADLLVLAGDVGSYQYGSRLSGADFGLERFSPRRGWPVPVLYLPGNHEYDAVDFDATHARLRETCERLGITWLERETVVIAGRRFVGTTLWSDFDALALQANVEDKGLKPVALSLKGSASASPQAAQWAVSGQVNTNNFAIDGNANLSASPLFVKASARFDALDLNTLLPAGASAGAKPEQTAPAPADIRPSASEAAELP